MGVWKKGSLAVSRQRVIRAKTLKRGAELHRYRERRRPSEELGLACFQSQHSRATGGREKPTDSGTMVARER